MLDIVDKLSYLLHMLLANACYQYLLRTIL